MPSWLAAGQDGLACSAAPELCCAASISAVEHCWTPASLPDRPGGIVTLTPDRSCSPSLRENVRLNGENAPAAGLDVPALKDGANAPPQPEANWDCENGEGVASAWPSSLSAPSWEYGSSAVVVV